VRILISMAVIAEGRESTFHRIAADGHTIFLDSGAYTNFTRGSEVVSLSTYMAFIERHHGSIWYYINLDVIGDNARSRQNYAEMVRCGFSPVPVITKGISISEIKETVQQSDFYAIGALAMESPSAKGEILRIYSHAGVNLKKAHILGCSNPLTIYRFKPRSFDSATYTRAGISGCQLLYDPIALTCRQIAEQDTDAYSHYWLHYGGGHDRKVISAAEAFRLSEHAELWGSSMFFVVSNNQDYGYLQRGHELYLQRKERRVA